MANTRTIGIYIYRDAQRDGIKMEWKRKLKGGGLYSLIYQPREFQTTIYDKLCFSSRMGGREGLLLAGGFICLLFLALHGYRLARIRSRSSRWKFAEGHSCLSLSPFLFLFSFFESATITTDLSDHGLINDAFRLAASKNLLSLLAQRDEHPSAIVLRDRTRNFARISSHRHCFLR